MTKNEALAALAIKKKLSHVYFEPHEYFFLSSPGYYQFEDGAVIDTETFWNEFPPLLRLGRVPSISPANLAPSMPAEIFLADPMLLPSLR